MKSQLHPHQQTALNLLRQSLGTGHSRPVLQAPTGFGKTVLGAAIVEGALAKGNRVIFVVPAVSLINQTAQRFWSEGIRDIGIIQADHPMTDYSKPVQIASIQTIQSRGFNRLPDTQVVIVDECHIWFKTYKSWMESWTAVPFIGLSATPWTKGLGKHYDDLLIASTTQDLIDNGYLSDFKVYAPSHPDLSKVRTVAGDYHEGDLATVMGDKKLVCDVVRVWKENGEGRPTLCFAVDRAHAKKLQQDFISSGVTAEYIDAYTEIPERERIAKQFHDGSVKVVCNVGCLTTGIDWDVRCIILARPTKSEMLFVQMIGRGLRTAEGKSNCLILDHSDTHLRLGFVTDVNHETLDDGRKKQSKSKDPEKPLPKDCVKCGYVKAPRVHVCPACGFKPEKQSQVEHGEGQIAELDRKKKRNRSMTGPEKESFYGQLKQYSLEHGYNPHWADHKYREYLGCWPNHYKNAPLRPVEESTKKWIISQQIRYAKSRKAA